MRGARSPPALRTYQGDELIDLSLVDPDNRRPVDWEARRSALARLRAGAAPTRETMKLFVIHRALDLRARRPVAFAGEYTPLQAGADVCAFTRGEAGEVVVVVALRDAGLDAALGVHPGRYRDVLSGREHALAGATPAGRLVEGHGVALLERL